MTSLYTDYFSIVEDAVLSLVRTTFVARITDGVKGVRQFAKSDDSYLDQGYAHFLFTYPGDFPTLPIGGNTLVTTQWEVLLDAFVRWDATELEAWNLFKEWRGDLFYLFNLRQIGRTLDRTAGVERVVLTASDRPRYIPVDPNDELSDPAFIGQVMSLQVTQKINKV